jgi:hypothetical protein
MNTLICVFSTTMCEIEILSIHLTHINAIGSLIVGRYQYFVEIYCLNVQGLCSSDALVCTVPTILRGLPSLTTNIDRHFHLRENLKSHIIFIIHVLLFKFEIKGKIKVADWYVFL